ncbi:uracil phosphoribosyltransferase [Nostoc sp. FACHB-133]|uniref:uracil phosphoribosyltransferase n=1 Tax=Nostoc sp. FACHB-133 TaxID=2692835 RepID=UPI001683F9C0|nr:uracil phosphoribosyltransferase [Nostoc sp. FACHB-133]MBD2525003.1 hypothetical protein [Nostoc sp. FACHB-133]
MDAIAFEGVLTSNLAAIGYPNKPLMKSLRLVQIYAIICLFAAPSGVERFCKQYYNVIFYTYLIDDNLDKYSYIIPGLGNAGYAYTY